MPFLDREGLAHFWNQIIARLSKYETTENAQLKLDEAKSYTDNSIPTKVTDLENDAEYITADALSGLGGGDMLKATYDKNGDGVVDDAEKLGGVEANKYAKKTDIPTVPTNVGAFTNDKGYLTSYTETDPKFMASAAAGIKVSDITNWNNKSNFSGNYNDLTGKPTIPTVNNATLTIQKNGTTVKTFTANSASNVTANITVPTKTSELTNDSGYITANDIPEGGGGTDIDYGSSLPTNGSEGDVFLLTDSTGATFTETINVDSGSYGSYQTFKLSNKIRAVTNIAYSDESNYPSYEVSGGMLKIGGDLYNPMTATVTYVSDGRWEEVVISAGVSVDVTSYGSSISEVVVKATDSGNCITILIDYNLSNYGSGGESWSFGLNDGANKTFLAAFALTGNGLVTLENDYGYDPKTYFGQSMNNISLPLENGVPCFSGQKAVLVIYYA